MLRRLAWPWERPSETVRQSGCPSGCCNCAGYGYLTCCYRYSVYESGYCGYATDCCSCECYESGCCSCGSDCCGCLTAGGCPLPLLRQGYDCGCG